MTPVATILRAITLAQLSPGQMGKSFQDYTANSQQRVMTSLVSAAIMVLALVVIWLAIIRQRQRRKPYEMFFELCALHTIGRPTERKLIHLARSHRIANPALLFVCPDLLKEIQSLEMSDAKNEKERKRLETFFSDFMSKAFG